MRRWPIVFVAIAVSAWLAPMASAEDVPNDYIVVLKDSSGDPVSIVAQHKKKYGAKPIHTYRSAIKGYAAELSDKALRGVKADPAVRFVSPDRVIDLPKPKVPACCRSHSQDPQEVGTGIDRIDGEASSTRSGDGHGKVNVNVAVIDTGVDPKQPELDVAGGYNCATEDPRAWQDVDPDFGHGTAAAGFIASQDNPIGEVGIAPGARIWSVRVFDEQGFGSTSAVICAADWIASTRTDRVASNDIAVANFSGSEDPDESELVDDQNCGLTNGDAEHLAICRLTSLGIVWVNSAGNESLEMSCCLEPTYDEVLAVTAVGDYDGRSGGLAAASCGPFDDKADFDQDDDEFAFFSNFTTQSADGDHTVAAPGACLKSTTRLANCSSKKSPTCYVTQLYGTSFSAPLATGTVALCIHSGSCAGLTPPQIIDKIVADAAAYNLAHPGYGFVGDPLRPITGKYYGYLIRAGLY